MKKQNQKPRSKKTNRAMQNKVSAAQFLRIQKQILKELFHEYRFQTSAVILISCVTSIGWSFLNLKFLEYAVNSVADYAGGNFEGDMSTLLLPFAGFLLALLFIEILSALYGRIYEKYKSNVAYNAERKITRQLADIPYELYESKACYDKINLARQASGQYSNAISSVTQMFKIGVMLIVYTVMLSRLNLFFLAVVFFSIIASISLSAYVTDKQLDYWRIHVSPAERINRYFRQIFNSRINHQNIQMNRSLPYFLNRYSLSNRRECANYLKLNLLSFTTEFGATMLFMVTFIVTALYTGKGVAQGRYEIGYFTMVISLLFQLFHYLKSFSMFLNQQNWYIKVLEAYYDILKTIPTEDTVPGNIPDTETDRSLLKSTEDSPEAIVLRNISYRYPQSQHQALAGASARFRMGEKIAVTGVNGSGKTTLISVILSLLKAGEGEYLGKEIPKTAVLQDFCQYQMTIRQNIEIGCGGRELPEEKVWDILRQVGLYDTVAALSHGIHTVLGQLNDGIELSKGQWQRLVVGRLLADEDARIWILDEPAAYLDPIAEVEMYKQIWKLSGSRLVFFISHRLGFAQNADRIIVVDSGRITETGTHRQLMDLEGLYASMFRGQQEWYT